MTKRGKSKQGDLKQASENVEKGGKSKYGDFKQASENVEKGGKVKCYARRCLKLKVVLKNLQL